MPFNPNAKSAAGEFNLVPNGIHAARCARIIEIGQQHSPRYDRVDEVSGATVPSISDKAIIIFSLSNVTFAFEGMGEKQAFISNRYGVAKSTNDRSTMKQYSKALDPKGVATHLKDFLNMPCQLSVVHVTKDGKTYANLDSVAPILPGLQIPELDTDPFMFEWDAPDARLWEKIPQHTQDLITGAWNFKGSKVEKMLERMTSNQPVI